TARHWADQFERWAGRLGEKDKSQAGSGSGKAGAGQMQALLALMRLRQQQDQLRQQTSVIEEQKQTSRDYPAAAQDAAGQQSTLSDQVRTLEQDSSFPVPPERLSPIGNAMSDAAGLLSKPETGKPTYDAQ